MNLFKIPRKIDPAVADRWALIRKHGRSRKAMVAFICGIGGYDRRDRFAIEFNIKAYNARLDADTLWGMLTSGKMDVGPDNINDPVELGIVRAMFNKAHASCEQRIWEMAVESTYENWADSDTPQETWLGERVEWKWEVHGRSGGHLCMTECEGINLKLSTEDLEEALNESDEDGFVIPTDRVRKLFIICAQNTCEITADRIAREMEYQAAWRLWVSYVEDDVEAAVELYRHRQHLAESVEDVLRLVGGNSEAVETVKALCKLAAVVVKD